MFRSGLGCMGTVRFIVMCVVCVWMLIFVKITNVVKDQPMMSVASVMK